MDKTEAAREVLARHQLAWERTADAIPVSVTGKRPSYYIRDGQSADVSSRVAIAAMLEFASPPSPSEGENVREVCAKIVEDGALLARLQGTAADNEAKGESVSRILLALAKDIRAMPIDTAPQVQAEGAGERPGWAAGIIHEPGTDPDEAPDKATVIADAAGEERES